MSGNSSAAPTLSSDTATTVGGGGGASRSTSQVNKSGFNSRSLIDKDAWISSSAEEGLVEGASGIAGRITESVATGIVNSDMTATKQVASGMFSAAFSFVKSIASTVYNEGWQALKTAVPPAAKTIAYDVIPNLTSELVKLPGIAYEIYSNKGGGATGFASSLFTITCNLGKILIDATTSAGSALLKDPLAPIKLIAAPATALFNTAWPYLKHAFKPETIIEELKNTGRLIGRTAIDIVNWGANFLQFTGKAVISLATGHPKDALINGISAFFGEETGQHFAEGRYAQGFASAAKGVAYAAGIALVIGLTVGTGGIGTIAGATTAGSAILIAKCLVTGFGKKVAKDAIVKATEKTVLQKAVKSIVENAIEFKQVTTALDEGLSESLMKRGLKQAEQSADELFLANKTQIESTFADFAEATTPELRAQAQAGLDSLKTKITQEAEETARKQYAEIYRGHKFGEKLEDWSANLVTFIDGKSEKELAKMLRGWDNELKPKEAVAMAKALKGNSNELLKVKSRSLWSGTKYEVDTTNSLYEVMTEYAEEQVLNNKKLKEELSQFHKKFNERFSHNTEALLEDMKAKNYYDKNAIDRMNVAKREIDEAASQGFESGLKKAIKDVIAERIAAGILRAKGKKHKEDNGRNLDFDLEENAVKKPLVATSTELPEVVVREHTYSETAGITKSLEEDPRGDWFTIKGESSLLDLGELAKKAEVDESNAFQEWVNRNDNNLNNGLSQNSNNSVQASANNAISATQSSQISSQTAGFKNRGGGSTVATTTRNSNNIKTNQSQTTGIIKVPKAAGRG